MHACSGGVFFSEDMLDQATKLRIYLITRLLTDNSRDLIN